MYHLCETEYCDIDSGTFAEQITILLFETIYPSVFNLSNSNHPQAGEFKTDHDFANDLLHTAQDVFRVTGWSGGCITNGDFGASVDLNWKTPVVQNDMQRSLWTKTYSRGKGYEFRRTTKKLPTGLTLLRLTNLASLCTPKFLLTVPARSVTT